MVEVTVGVPLCGEVQVQCFDAFGNGGVFFFASCTAVDEDGVAGVGVKQQIGVFLNHVDDKAFNAEVSVSECGVHDVDE